MSLYIKKHIEFNLSECCCSGSLLTWETPPPRLYADGRYSQGPLQLRTQRLVALKREKFLSQQTTGRIITKLLHIISCYKLLQ